MAAATTQPNAESVMVVVVKLATALAVHTRIPRSILKLALAWAVVFLWALASLDHPEQNAPHIEDVQAIENLENNGNRNPTRWLNTLSSTCDKSF